jgi:cysteine desulfurase
MQPASIYFDHAATTPIDPKVWEKMTDVLFNQNGYANSSAIHRLGILASTYIEKARQQILETLAASESELIFVSSGTEANNWVVKSLVETNKSKLQPHWILSRGEHSSLTKLVDWANSKNIKVTFLDLDENGKISLDQVESVLRRESCNLFSLHHANSETGVIQPIEALGKILRKYQVPFHVDACQSFLKTELKFSEWGISYITLSSHKIHGPKGIAGLVINKSSDLPPLLLGGGQEKGKRSSTLFTEGIVGFGEAVSLFTNESRQILRQRKNYLVSQLKLNLKNIVFNGDIENSIDSIINFQIPYFSGKELQKQLSRLGICVSTGSACHSSNKVPSPVLTAMGLSEPQAFSSLRISISKFTTQEEIDFLVESLLSLTTKKVTKNVPFKTRVA